jgi:hypothetical protein
MRWNNFGIYQEMQGRSFTHYYESRVLFYQRSTYVTIISLRNGIATQ